MVQQRKSGASAKQSHAKRLAPFPSEAALHTGASALDAVEAKRAPRFARAEPRRRVLSYLTGLLSTAERKNGGQPAGRAGDTTPRGNLGPIATPPGGWAP